jgi:hypothetical protein
MIEAKLDLWAEPADAKCITTNGFVKNNGNLVMGAGVAGQAQSRYPQLPKIWGESYSLRKGYHRVGARTQDEPPKLLVGPHAQELRVQDDLTHDFTFVSFPVKYNWYEKADLNIIKNSAYDLAQAIEDYGWEKVLLPRPGCGNGQLDWEEVMPIIAPFFPHDRVWVIWSDNSFRR